MPTIYDNPMFQLQPQGVPAPTSGNTFGPQGAFGPASTGSGYQQAPLSNAGAATTTGTGIVDPNNVNTFTGTVGGNAFAPTQSTAQANPNTFGPQGAFGAPATGSGYGYISPRDKVASGMMNYGYRRFAPHGMFGGI